MNEIKLTPKIVEKPWGREQWLVVTEKYVLKILEIKKGHRFSLQYHEIKDEAWLVIKGKLLAVYGEEKLTLIPGDIVRVPPKTIHRLKALEDAEIIEVSTPELEDVVRLEDDYSRK